ncbi:MAG: phosphoribosyltransferase [Pseudobdellovibrionaceae bacterium]
MVFKSREDAAQKLLKLLIKYKNQNPIVVGIPRGAVPMAKIIAEALNGELNAILVHKIPAPFQEELAIGSIGLSGKIHRLPMADSWGISEAYIEKEAARQLDILKKRQEKFNLPALNCKNHLVIIVDDGIATGATAIGAIHEIRLQKPRKLVFAAGVVAKNTADTIRSLVDEFITLEEPDFFYAVSQFFTDFAQVTDEKVVEIFKHANRQKPPTSADIHP